MSAPELMAAFPLDDRWRLAVLTEHVSVADVIRNLNASTLQIALVVREDGTLVGTATDGDIRRGLLRGVELQDGVTAIMNRDPLVVPPDMSRELVRRLMQANRIRQLPVVEADRRVVGLHLWDQVIGADTRPNLVVVMAGGEGQRLRPLTADCPKPMLPVAGKPMLEHILDRARSEGLYRFRIAVRYLGRQIEEYFGDGRPWGIEIEYLREDTPLGTAGALGLLPSRPVEPIVVCNGDVLADIRFGELIDFHVAHRAVATMAVRPHEWEHPFGVVQTSGVDITAFEEKPVTRTRINAGVYVLSPEALDALPPGDACDMPALFTRVRDRQGRTIAYPMHEPWLDIGRADDLERARRAATAAPAASDGRGA